LRRPAIRSSEGRLLEADARHQFLITRIVLQGLIARIDVEVDEAAGTRLDCAFDRVGK
jgi:hypothetical protein